jgi:hypothetical protein
MKILNFKKSILVLMLGCFVSVTMAQQKRMDANHFLASALRKAATEKKPVLLLCYASWNSWSKIFYYKENSYQRHRVSKAVGIDGGGSAI